MYLYCFGFLWWERGIGVYGVAERAKRKRELSFAHLIF